MWTGFSEKKCTIEKKIAKIFGKDIKPKIQAYRTIVNIEAIIVNKRILIIFCKVKQN